MLTHMLTPALVDYQAYTAGGMLQASGLPAHHTYLEACDGSSQNEKLPVPQSDGTSDLHQSANQRGLAARGQLVV